MKREHFQLSTRARSVIYLAAGSSAGDIVHQINTWLAMSGPEWTVDRLKAIRVAALQLRAGNRDKARLIYQQNSIAYHPGTLLPRGPYGPVVRNFSAARRPSTLKAWDTVLRAYTSIYLRDTSPRQLSKAKRSITTPYQGQSVTLDDVCGWMRNSGLNMRPMLGTLKTPNVNRLKMFTSTHRVQPGEPSQLKATPYGKLARSLLTEVAWPKRTADRRTNQLLLEGKVDYIRLARERVLECGFAHDGAPGYITLIQEAGCKPRVVAVPTALYQWYFEPLHKALADLAELLPVSCVGDQTSGAYWVKDKVEYGSKPIYCFDLSSATDRFPRRLQQELLRGLGLDCYADDLEDACKGWIGLDGEPWNYSVGQPMGLYSSFPLFHLTHCCLIMAICEIHGMMSDPPFRVLGDDVVIADAYVAEHYERLMRSLGVDLSPVKTIISDRVAEFAGFVITKNGKTTSAYRPYKYGPKRKKDPRGHVHAPINLLANVGRRVRKWGPYWSQKFVDFQTTRSWRNLDLSPIMSGKDDGGLQPPVMDTTRLHNLIRLSIWDLNPEGKGHLEDWSVGFASQLLGEEPCELHQRNLLCTPIKDTDPDERPTKSAASAMRDDPLMSRKANFLPPSIRFPENGRQDDPAHEKLETPQIYELNLAQD